MRKSLFLGLMSGTSLDGVDAVLLEVEDEESAEGVDVSSWRVAAFLTRPYSPGERAVIQDAITSGGPRELAPLHATLGEWFAETALSLLEEVRITAEDVEAIGSHGQTVWHDPPGKGRRGSSLQLGCPATLAERTGIDVVSDFRARDLAAGGHGAPLVPWADRIFFSSPKGPRALQNLGGMGNVTWLPARDDSASLLGFDTGPGVALLNIASSRATGGAWAYDRDGSLAARGTASDSVLETLLSHPFFREEPPRSTGRELFGEAMVDRAAELLEDEMGEELVPGDRDRGWPHLLATLTAFTARSVGDAYRKWVLPRGVDEVFLLGGGARNPVLAEAIGNELHPLPVRSGEVLGMDPDAREAAAFALLAWAHVRRIPGNCPEATGSEGPRVLGSWTPAGKRMRMP